MERITELKFQKLETKEMQNLKGAAVATSENMCQYVTDKITNGGVEKSREAGQWFSHKDDWTSCPQNTIQFE